MVVLFLFGFQKKNIKLNDRAIRGITIRCTRSRGPRGFFCLHVFSRGPVNVDVMPLERSAWTERNIICWSLPLNWQFQRHEIASGVLRYSYLDSESRVLTFKDVLELWADVAQCGNLFLGFHCQVLTDVPYAAYKWETPAVDIDRLERPFEFVALNAPRLDRPEDRTAFQKQFAAAGDDRATVAFSNLGKNAVLVVPCPSMPGTNHCHLASFLRTCHASDESSLWQQVGISMLERVAAKPVWLSTAGGGVAWLHVRLDDKPKYYGYREFKSS